MNNYVTGNQFQFQVSDKVMDGVGDDVRRRQPLETQQSCGALLRSSPSSLIGTPMMYSGDEGKY